ncbi:MAG: transketolase, partial [Planctomycetes bacterium]|nr:transketolase [Planctomycetota bacterium]
HQPVEQLMAFRVMPNVKVVRPCDANETVEAWRLAMENQDGPVALILSRQNLPVLDRSRMAPAAGLARGAYVLSDPQGDAPRAVIIATGSEVHVALAAQKLLADKGVPVRVVSMPCWEAFEAQSEQYRESVLPPAIKARVAVEAGATLGWWRWLGDGGVTVGLNRFGASAPGKTNMERFGFTPQHVARCVEETLTEAKE